MTIQQPYHCPQCDGAGEDECPHCGQDMECAECDGTGYNLELLDHERFHAAQKRLQKLGAVCDWVRDDVCVGRRTMDGTSCIACRDFLRPGQEPAPGDDARSCWHDPAQQELFSAASPGPAPTGLLPGGDGSS